MYYQWLGIKNEDLNIFVNGQQCFPEFPETVRVLLKWNDCEYEVQRSRGQGTYFCLRVKFLGQMYKITHMSYNNYTYFLQSANSTICISSAIL